VGSTWGTAGTGDILPWRAAGPGQPAPTETLPAGAAGLVLGVTLGLVLGVTLGLGEVGVGVGVGVGELVVGVGLGDFDGDGEVSVGTGVGGAANASTGMPCSAEVMNAVQMRVG
jgi:hypothetical protein